LKNQLLTVIVVAFLAGAAGYWLKPEGGPTPSEREALENYKNLREKLDQLGQVDIEEYLRLKDQKARYEKADEILGKVLMLMLYDLGLRKSESQLQALKKKPAPVSAPADLPPAAAPDVSGPPAETVKAAPAEEKPPAVVKKNTERPAEIYSRSQVDDFLRSAEIPNFFNELRGGAMLNESQLEILNGSYYGRAIFDDPKDPPWQVEMRVDVRIEAGKYTGTHDIRLSKNGKQFSRTRSGGRRGRGTISNESYLGIEGDENAILVNAYGSDGYFQLYHFPRLNEYHGLVYLKKSIGNFERKGVVHLTKR